MASTKAPLLLEDDEMPPSDQEDSAAGSDEETLEYSDSDEDETKEGEPKRTKAYDYAVLTRESIQQQQESAIAHCKPIVGDLPLFAVRTLLQRFQWDTHRMLTEWSDNPDKVLEASGLPSLAQLREWAVAAEKMLSAASAPSASSSSGGTNAAGEFDCLICMMSCPMDEVTSLPCGHSFCNDCWKAYLAVQIKEKKKLVTCPGGTTQRKCHMVVDEFTVIRLLGDKAGEKKFLDSIVDSFVEDNANIKWCPTAGCTRAIHMKESGWLIQNEAVTCGCGATWCFRCGNEAHCPATCGMYREWNTKNMGKDDTVDRMLISLISRPCPSCKTPIQKNEGCHHMTCGQCQYHFCWLCMGKFGEGKKGGSDGYGNHKCNSYWEQDNKVKNLMTQQELERFGFYAARFNSHNRSLGQEREAETALHAVVLEEMGQLFGAAPLNLKFLDDAVKQLLRNRSIVAWSYVFGYYRPLHFAFVLKDIFENLQENLETQTEILSGHFTPLDPAKLWNCRDAIINQTKVAKSVADALIDASTEWGGDLPAPKPAGGFNAPGAAAAAAGLRDSGFAVALGDMADDDYELQLVLQASLIG